jgi:pimeloyl-ACP methyl ester carboxylesterase
MARRFSVPIFLLALALTTSAVFAPLAVAQTTDQQCASAQGTGMVAANGITIAYESFGSCSPETVLLIGGTGQQLVEWPMELVQELLQRGYRVVRFDNRDVGLSTHLAEAGYPDSEAITRALEQNTPPPLPYTLRDMASDAVGLLDALAIEQAHLVGASMGGNIAQLVAIDHPERVSSLTTIGADSANPAVPVIADPEAFATLPAPPAEGDRAAFVEYQVKTYQVRSSPAYPPAEETLRQAVARSVERAYDPAGLVRQQTVTLVGRLERDNYRYANLEQITAPTAIIQGADDPLQSLASAQDLAARIPGSELFLIPGLAHDLPPELAPLFAAAVERVATREAPSATFPPLPPGAAARPSAGLEPPPAWRTHEATEAHLEEPFVPPGLAPSEQPPSDRPVGAQLGWLLDVLNARAGALTEAELTARFAPELLAMVSPELLRGFVLEGAAPGPFTFQGFTRPPLDTQAVALVTGAGGVPFALPLAVEATPPHRITGLNVMPVPPPPGVELRPYAPGAESDRVDGLVDIGGRGLYRSCRGAGSPTVVLESGLGDSAATWFAVETAVAGVTRVCSYDRANAFAGASHSAPTPRSGQEIAGDLHALLRAGDISGPFVLVGHSIGGHFLRLYAAEHPEDVAGMVLVDASHEEWNARLEALVGPELWARAQQGMAQALNPEGVDLDTTARQVRSARAANPLPPTPLVVLTHGQPGDPSAFPPGWPVQEELQLWRALQADLADLVPNGRQVIAERSGHYIHQSEPGLVIDAIRDVVGSRGASPRSGPG